ncbi:uncharacterized protein [Apostichopus japonicus]
MRVLNYCNLEMSTKAVIERSGARKTRTPARSGPQRPRSSSAGRLNVQSDSSSRGRSVRPISHPAENKSDALSDYDIRMYIANRNPSCERPAPVSSGRLYSKSQTREKPVERTPRRDRSMSPSPLRTRPSATSPIDSSPSSAITSRKQSYLRSSSVDALTRSHSPFAPPKAVHIGLKSPGSPSSFVSKTQSAKGTVKLEGINNSTRNAQVLKKFGEYRLQGRLIDLTLGFFGGLEIKCHRIVLASASTYFKSLLSSGNRHVTRHDFIQMRGVQYSVMDILVDYAYSGTIAGVERDMMASLTESSRVFKFKDVHEACKSYLHKEKKSVKSRTIAQLKHIETLSEDGLGNDSPTQVTSQGDVGRTDDDSGQESSSEVPPSERTDEKDRKRYDSGNDSTSLRSTLSSSDFTPPDFSYNNPKHANDIVREINRTRREAILFDVVLRTQTKDFPCQRLVLETGSSYLSHLITQELQGSKHMDVFLTRIPSDVLQKLVGYLYTGKMEITDRDVRKVYKWAKKFQLNEVCEACCTLDDTIDTTKSIVSEKTTLTNPE